MPPVHIKYYNNTNTNTLLNVTLHHKTTKKSPDMDFKLRADSKRGDSKL